MAKRARPQSPIILVQEYSISQEIAEMQLNRLREYAKERLLSYEETKIFDLLTKNLLLAKGEATGIIDTTATQKHLPESEEQQLLTIAKFVEPEKISEVLNVVEEAKDGSDQDPIKQS